MCRCYLRLQCTCTAAVEAGAGISEWRNKCTPLAIQGTSRFPLLLGLCSREALLRRFPGLVRRADHRLRAPPVPDRQRQLTQRPR